MYKNERKIVNDVKWLCEMAYGINPEMRDLEVKLCFQVLQVWEKTMYEALPSFPFCYAYFLLCYVFWGILYVYTPLLHNTSMAGAVSEKTDTCCSTCRYSSIP